ncbi:MAG: sulfite exporter TauE/SafE family protein [Alicyclobacillus macrosporangiidus]|uniref:sulfite exporter TauE/SafE family protein n=1 Tax=Alicyclobacillus macrosporangiidus TaxID=392015 RepID=UPI0026EF3C98|nr:sulfite exporter TauE/SafE family protein [Alicyclobacillus macrosporangiidus]MCL6599785.1 sulfite exporter TauE/SafE family protein [Alicyclobacillus macrosporangiidus]
MPHLTGVQMVLAFLSGGVVGFTLGLIGGGGSILAVPLLLYFVGVHDPHVVIGSTALAVAVNAYLNLVPHWRQGHVRWKAAMAFAIPGAIGAYAGSTLGKLANGKVLLFLFAILMLVIAVRMMRSKQNREAGETRRPIRMGRVIPTGLVTGLVSGFFGIGGGFLIVPGLIFSAGLPMTEAIGTSLFSVGTFGLTTAVSYAISGMVDWLIVGLYLGGGLIGGVFGVYACTRIGRNVRRLQQLFSGVLVVVACYMLYVNLMALHWL